MNHAQTVSGIRNSVMPFALRFSVVVRKFSDVNSEPTQNIAMLMAHSVCPNPRPGPATWPSALNGAYAVHPEIGAPPVTNSAEIITHHETKVTQNESMLSVGKAMSRAPIWIGRK